MQLAHLPRSCPGVSLDASLQFWVQVFTVIPIEIALIHDAICLIALQELDETLPKSRKIDDDTYKVFVRTESQKKMLCMKKNRQQILQLSPTYASHPRSIRFMLGLLAQLPLSQEALVQKKASFIKDPASVNMSAQEFDACAPLSILSAYVWSRD